MRLSRPLRKARFVVSKSGALVLCLLRQPYVLVGVNRGFLDPRFYAFGASAAAKPLVCCSTCT